MNTVAGTPGDVGSAFLRHRVWVRRRKLCATLAALYAGIVAIWSATIGLAAEVPTVWGQPVLRIRLECDAQLDIDDFADRLAQKMAEPLNHTKIAESLRNLYATGRFSELRADAEPLGSGVELVFVARAAFFIGVVRVEGAPKIPEPRALISASRLRLGQPISEDDLALARKRVRALLAESGYYEANIDHQILPNPENQVADIVFSVVPGPPAKLGEVVFQGELTVPARRLLKATGWRPGIQLTPSRLEGGILKLRQFYVARGRLQASVDIRERSYSPQLRTGKLVVYAEAGPLVHVNIRGGRVSSSKMKELLPFLRDGVADENALESGRQSPEDYFQRQGFHSASIEVERKTHGDPKAFDITYIVRWGERGLFVGYAFKGNRTIPPKHLAAALTVHPKDFFRERGIFSRELLARDVSALTEIYII